MGDSRKWADEQDKRIKQVKANFKSLPDVVQALIGRAGLDALMIDNGEDRPEFEAILTAMSEIRRGKEALYGSFIQNRKRDSEGFALMTHFIDMRRKWVRAENFMNGMFEKGKEFSNDELLDTYIDLAIYSALGVQLLVAIKKGELE